MKLEELLNKKQYLASQFNENYFMNAGPYSILFSKRDFEEVQLKDDFMQPLTLMLQKE
jgi:hypothetical protein